MKKNVKLQKNNNKNLLSIASVKEKKNAILTLKNRIDKRKKTLQVKGEVKSGGSLHLDIFPGRRNVELMDIAFVLEERAEAVVRILFHGKEKTKFDCNIIQKHTGNFSYSKVEFRGVLDDFAELKFNGLVDIPKNITGAIAEQKSYNLVLSKGVKIFTEPAMEVGSNESECIHGSAIGGIDPEIYFYMCSRGLSENVSKELYISGFLS